MSFLHLGNDHSTYIFAPTGAIKRRSKNLRGMLKYARVSKVVRIELKRIGNGAGLLKVVYADNCFSIAEFSSFDVMTGFVSKRRTWQNATRVCCG